MMNTESQPIDGRTNQERRFLVGDVIRYAGDDYIVTANYGRSGNVREFPNGDYEVCFAWDFCGESCVLVRASDAG